MSAYGTRSVSAFYSPGRMSDEERSLAIVSSPGSTPEPASGVPGDDSHIRSKPSPGKESLVVFS